MLLSEKAMAPHSSTLAWKIPWTEEPGGLLRVGHDWATSLSLSLHAIIYVCVYVPCANETLKPFMGIFQMKILEGMSWRLCCYSSWLVCSLILTFLSLRISIQMWISHINAPRDLKNYLTPFINCSILTDFLMSNHVSLWFSVFPSSLCMLIYENHLLEKVWPHSSA